MEQDQKNRVRNQSCRENLWNETYKQTQEQNKKEWASLVGFYLGHKSVTSPPREGEPTRTQEISSVSYITSSPVQGGTHTPRKARTCAPPTILLDVAFDTVSMLTCLPNSSSVGC